MELEEKIELLYDKDLSLAYNNLLELEKLSEEENTLYNYFDDFLQMIDSEKYVIRIRGYRLLCKQARWDVEEKFNNIIDKLLLQIDDEKPTAVRQKLMALKDIVIYKSKFNSKIKKALLELDYLKFKDTMHSLIEKDITEVINLMNNKNSI